MNEERLECAGVLARVHTPSSPEKDKVGRREKEKEGGRERERERERCRIVQNCYFYF
jgi:hypothetical protein